MLLIPDCCKPAFIIYGIWVAVWGILINLQESSHSISLFSTEAEEFTHHWSQLVGHYSRYQRPAATKKMMEGTYTSVNYGEVAHILSQMPPGISTQPDTEVSQLFLFYREPHACGNFVAQVYATPGTAGKEDEGRRAGEGTSAVCTFPLSTCFTLEWWLCTKSQVPATSHSPEEQSWGSWACFPLSSCHCSISVTLECSWRAGMDGTCWQAQGAMYQDGGGGGLALGFLSFAGKASSGSSAWHCSHWGEGGPRAALTLLLYL